MPLNIPKNAVPYISEVEVIPTNTIVLIGANGSGKTRFGSLIRRINNESVMISAQKSLILPDKITMKTLAEAKSEFTAGFIQNEYKGFDSRQVLDPARSLLYDYEHLLVLLFAEEAAVSSAFRKKEIAEPGGIVPSTNLDIVQRIWESVITHKKITFGDFKVQVVDYSGSEMSDGERLIFYIIGQVICAAPNQVIIIDEPENHLHKAVVKSLYDQLEQERSDCTFVYLTHDLDFAFTRIEATKIWIRNFRGNNTWEYEILDPITSIPEQLYLEILGSRRPVLFIEGDNSSKDYKLYEKVFAEYTVKPLGGCPLVIQNVKSFNDQSGFHRIKCFGLIDRDRRGNAEVAALNEKNIWVLDVAEVENILVTEDVVRILAEQALADDPQEVVNRVKENVMQFFSGLIDEQVILHFKEEYAKQLNISAIPTGKSFEEINTELDRNFYAIDKNEMLNQLRVRFQSLVDQRDYMGILRVFNLKKGITANAKLCELINLSPKPSPVEAIYNKLLLIIKQNNDMSKQLKTAINHLIIKG